MRKLLLSTLLLIGVLFSGCPYDAHVPLCKYEEAIKKDKKLFGKWQVFHEEGAHNEIVVSKGDKWVMHVQNREFDENNEKTNDYYHRAFGTEIDGQVFYTIEKKDSTFNYYKFEWKSDDEFVLYGVLDKYMNKLESKVKSLDSEGMIEFIKQHMKKDGFFDEPFHFYREDTDLFKKKEKQWKEG